MHVPFFPKVCHSSPRKERGAGMAWYRLYFKGRGSIVARQTSTALCSRCEYSAAEQRGADQGSARAGRRITAPGGERPMLTALRLALALIITLASFSSPGWAS